MCTTCANTQLLEAARSDEFGQRMMSTMTASAVGLMVSIGHRTGLFDAMADGQSVTSHELAQKAELSERYVREWLGCMTCARITEFDPSTGRYRLPLEHAAWLTRAATPANMAASMQWISVLGSVEDLVVEAFSHGKGVPYSAYRRFNEVMAEESAQTCVAALDEHIVPLVEELRQRLANGINVIDIGCGSGRAMIHLAERYPRSLFNGLDYLDEAVATATATAESRGLTNVSFRQGDAAAWNELEQYDLITTFDAIHDQARPDVVLANIRRALRPGGVYLMQDIQGSSHVEQDVEHPLSAFFYAISCMHCMSVSLANGGMGLGAAWGKETALRMLKEARFEDVTVETLPHDPINYYYVCRT
jgi:2-polyprenyl-3-methyl-5-hydroxy-6-metoxy-1,4-benzoquinol methylase